MEIMGDVGTEFMDVVWVVSVRSVPVWGVHRVLDLIVLLVVLGKDGVLVLVNEYRTS